MTDARYIILEDGRRAPFDRSTIDDAVFRAGMAAPGCDLIAATILGEEIAKAAWWLVETKWSDRVVFIEDVHHIVASLLIGTGHAQIAQFVRMKDLRPQWPELLCAECVSGPPAASGKRKDRVCRTEGNQRRLMESRNGKRELRKWTSAVSSRVSAWGGSSMG